MIALVGLRPSRADSSATAVGTPESPLSLEQVFRLAFEQNPQILEALAGYRLALLQIDQAYLGLNPTLTMNADLLRNTEDRFGVNDAELQLTFQQPLFTFGKVRWNAEAARRASYQAAEQMRTAIESLFQNVASAYVEVKLAEQNLEVAKQRGDDRQRYLDLSRNLFRAGEIAEYEVVQAESTLLAAQTEILQQEMALAQAHANLLVNLGRRPDQPLPLAELPEAPPPPESLDQGLQQAIARRPELSALRWSVAAAEASVKARGLSNTPTLSLLGELDDERELRSNQMSQSWMIGLQFSWPLYDGGAARNQAQQGRVMAEQARQQLAQAERQVALDVASAHLSLLSLWRQLEVARQSLDKAEETNTIAEARFRAGLSSGVELLNAQDDLAQARSTLAEVLGQYRNGWVNWNRAISVAYPVEVPAGLEPSVTLGPRETAP